MRKLFIYFAIAGVVLAAMHAMSAVGQRSPVTLPNGWLVNAPPGAEMQTGTMPQGMAPSPDSSTLAVVESGYNPPSLGIYSVPGLARVESISLPGAFGRPVWADATHVLVAGANADALLDVDISAKTVRRIAFPKGSYPVLVAATRDRGTFAVATDADGVVRIGTLDSIGSARPIHVGGHPGGLAFSTDGTRLFATDRSGSRLAAIDVASGVPAFYPTGLHPSALAVDGDTLYVAESDADAIDILNASDLHLNARIPVGDASAPFAVTGVSPNAISPSGGTAFVSLGAANSIAVIRNGRLAGRMEAGWYPTDCAEIGDRLFVLDGKGEGARPNPQYRIKSKSDRDYIGAIEFGSLRAYDVPSDTALAGNPQGAAGWDRAVAGSIVRPDGPIRHVFFVLKENRTYDQVLGDVSAGNGDSSLTWFGAQVTPNQHAVAQRFGLFDNAYASGEVSSAGHMWADAAFANDYVERFWPPNYGGRRDLDDLDGGDGPRVPAGGFLWDAAARAHVSFRDYGEQIDPGKTPGSPGVAAVASLAGRFDPSYVGWNLDYSDLDRVKEWRREFTAMDAAGTLPKLEFIWLPNDHTYASKAGKLTPASYVALNDYAVGQMVETLTHSKAWKSSAMFVTEDDAQDGADHVSDQRTTFYVVSPYARPGVHHDHYATVSILRTVELLLGMQPLSTYDAMAVPMYGAFASLPSNSAAFAAVAPKVDVRLRNGAAAYGAKVSATLDFTRPDAVPGDTIKNILAHNH